MAPRARTSAAVSIDPPQVGSIWTCCIARRKIGGEEYSSLQRAFRISIFAAQRLSVASGFTMNRSNAATSWGVDSDICHSPAMRAAFDATRFILLLRCLATSSRPSGEGGWPRSSARWSSCSSRDEILRATRRFYANGRVAYTEGMTIDERLEALTQSLELWSHMQMDASKEYNERFPSLEQTLPRQRGAGSTTHGHNEPARAHLGDPRPAN